MSQPLQAGVIGLGRAGMFLLERWIAEPRLMVVAASDGDPARRSVAEKLCPHVAHDAAELLARTDLQAVLVDAPPGERATLGIQVLAAGKHLILEPPAADTISAAAELFATARAADRRIIVWLPWRTDTDFRMAEGTIRAGEIGRPRLLRFERWELRADGCRGESAGDGLWGNLSVVAMFDALNALSDRPAKTVTATPLAGGGLTATIRFDDQQVALLSLHFAAATRFDHGWTIDAERGGYAAGRRWIRTADGEAYHVPAEATASRTLEQTLLAGGDPPRETQQQSLRLIALLRAAEQSLETGAVVSVDPTEEEDLGFRM